MPAVAELAASDLLPAVRPGTLVVAVSASGSSAETLDAVRRLRAAGAGARFVALTNLVRHRSWASSATSRSTWPRARSAGAWPAGRSSTRWPCCSRWRSGSRDPGLDSARPAKSRPLLEQTAAASAHLLATRADWLPTVSTAALGPDGTHVVAPARRISSALQSALMLREGPRLPAVGCETADWSHVDVYLTKTTDYRLVLLAGSRWEPELLDWVGQRGSTLVAVGGEMPGAEVTVRYPHDDVDDVRLLTETLVAELVAAEAWRAQPPA